MEQLIAFEGAVPSVGEGVFLAPGARIIGRVQLAVGASVWFNAVLRGDVGRITVGARANIQDLALVHMTSGGSDVIIEDDVTVGHTVTLHGCTLRRRCLVGMGAIVLDGAEVGEEAMVGAGSVVPPGMLIPARSLALGAPARVKRPLRDDELARVVASGPHYAALAARYLVALVK